MNHSFDVQSLARIECVRGIGTVSKYYRFAMNILTVHYGHTKFIFSRSRKVDDRDKTRWEFIIYFEYRSKPEKMLSPAPHFAVFKPT
jgi:hypothetical protein